MNVLLSNSLLFSVLKVIFTALLIVIFQLAFSLLFPTECKSVTSSDFFLGQEISFYSQISISVFIWLELDQMMFVGAEKPWISGREFMAAVLPPHI